MGGRGITIWWGKSTGGFPGGGGMNKVSAGGGTPIPPLGKTLIFSVEHYPKVCNHCEVDGMSRSFSFKN